VGRVECLAEELTRLAAPVASPKQCTEVGEGSRSFQRRVATLEGVDGLTEQERPALAARNDACGSFRHAERARGAEFPGELEQMTYPRAASGASGTRSSPPTTQDARSGLRRAHLDCATRSTEAQRQECRPPAAARVLDPARLGDHLDRLYRAAWALCGSRERAEDLVQETYARVLSRPRRMHNDDDLGYLLRALRNTFISQLRTAGRRPQLATGDELERIADATAPQPHEVIEARRVYEVIAALAPDFRDVIVAVDVIGLRYDEAARALRIREATLGTRLFRARRSAAEMLRGHPAECSRPALRPRPR
jgi:RNA polymerase sigma-70 factor, ECF subfamily